jgi:hypothetical protein
MEYAAGKWGGPKAYAQKLVSTPGKRDGLYWPSTGGKDTSPLSALDVGADAGGEAGHGTLRGYKFRVLTAQGPNAPGGQRSYVANGRMTRGFALVASPGVYGSTGIMTFVVGDDGKIYQKDLGEKTDQLAAAMTEYDPDGSWKRVD